MFHSHILCLLPGHSCLYGHRAEDKLLRAAVPGVPGPSRYSRDAPLRRSSSGAEGGAAGVQGDPAREPGGFAVTGTEDEAEVSRVRWDMSEHHKPLNCPRSPRLTSDFEQNDPRCSNCTADSRTPEEEDAPSGDSENCGCDATHTDKQTLISVFIYSFIRCI